MNAATKKILAAGAAATIASFVAPIPASAQTAGMPARCYQWPVERLDVAWPGGNLFHTDPVLVTEGSPCRDINVRGMLDVDGKPTCRKLRVVYASTGVKGKWHRTCKKWTVLWHGAREGEAFTVEAQGRPSTVIVRS